MASFEEAGSAAQETGAGDLGRDTAAPRHGAIVAPPEGDHASAPTPMMTQYLAIKAQHPDCLLFYRMGDFYELFFDDAVKAAAALDIALTARGKHLGESIPMCGVPVHSHEGYLARLIRHGFRIAVCEQTEDPKQARRRGGKSVVHREIVRVITAGTITEDTLLDGRRNNYLAACAEAGGTLGVAWLDMSTGDFSIQPFARGEMDAVLARLDPREILLPESMVQQPELFETLQAWRDRLTPLPASRFDSVNGRRRLESLYRVGSLDAFGQFSRGEVAAAGALVDYVDLTQKGKLPRIARPRRVLQGAVLEIDAATRRNLELTRTLAGETKGSLLSTIDRTVTGAGARLLAARLTAPLTDISAINNRLDMVQFFTEDSAMRQSTRELLRHCPDVERALARLSLARGGPRDLAAVRGALALAAELRGALTATGLSGVPGGIEQCLADLGHHGPLVDRLTRALAADLPLQARDGGFVAPGYLTELDEQRTLRDQSRRVIAELQARYAGETGIQNLKIRHNNVLGYFIEIPAKQADRIRTDPKTAGFIHRQTMANVARYTSIELGDLQDRITRAGDQALAMEMAIFDDLVAEVVGRAEAIALAAAALARLDVAAGLAELAVGSRYTRPWIDDSLDFEIRGGRHPVVEAALGQDHDHGFVGNDCDLGEGRRLWLLTGPNMAGKSTFLRQNGLIALLAQMGSYVPAESARLGVVDRLFSRIGAGDELARGRSTFMVEMLETAAILHQAGPRALVIFDEIGRGTATYDGLSIAWAVVEHLHEVNRCRALFATHYHELTALAAKLENLACFTMRVKEWQGDVVFLHEVAPGTADRSYGIHVGQLAGLPAVVVARAGQVLETLEKGEQSSAITRLADDLPLFAAAARPVAPELKPSRVEQELRALNADELTPRAALELVYRWKENV
jgi:DNA mismatch repair protein MutS